MFLILKISPKEVKSEPANILRALKGRIKEQWAHRVLQCDLQATLYSRVRRKLDNRGFSWLKLRMKTARKSSSDGA